MTVDVRTTQPPMPPPRLAFGVRRRVQRPATVKQLRVLDAIRTHIKRYTWPPTTRELARAVGLTAATVEGHLEALVRKQLIRRHRGIARGIVVLRAR